MKLENIKKELNQIKENDNFRTVKGLRMLSATHGIDSTGKNYTVFSSNNYLGLTHEKSVIEAGKIALDYGSGSTGSRLTSGGTFELSELEKNLAYFKHTEAALAFNTGYMTNLGVLYALAGKNSVIFSDQLNHASIIDGCKISGSKAVIYRHNDMNHLQSLLESTPVPEGGLFLVTDGVFSMDGDIANLPALIELKKKYSFCLIVDDAHAVGVIGKSGRGTAEYYGIESGIDIQIGTLSKALASEGGYAATSKEIRDYLVNKSRPFIFSTSLPPSVAAAANQALDLLQANGKDYMAKLKENTALMRKLLEEGGLPLVNGSTPIIPILTGSSKKALDFAQRCLSRGIMLSAIRPPTVSEGTSRIRLTVTAAHTTEEIEKSAQIIKETWSEL
ncbi:MAG: 8-amino-7-oxononanoate synthase [Treponema sp.]|nr:8-amino-7-oxononanoate synthase [Treponema sp.]